MRRVFYGWVVLGGLCLAYAASNGILLSALPLFYPSLIDEFGWTESQVTQPAALSFLATAIFSLFVGFLVDKFKPRVLMVAGSTVYVCVLVVLSSITTLTQMSALYVGISVALSLNGILPSMVIASRWFAKYRGVAVGILLMSSSLGGAIMPPIIAPVIEVEGWRAACMAVAGIGLFMMVLPCIFLVRNDPSEAQSVPDGRGFEMDESQPEVKGKLSGISVRDAMKSPMFYLLAFATGVMWFCITGVVQHQSIYLVRDVGIPLKDFSNALVLYFVSSVIGKFLFGWLSDHFDKANIMMLATVNLTVGLVLFSMIKGDSAFSLRAYAVVYGIGFSGAFTMIQLMIADLFAGPTYGSILGMFVFIDTLAGAVGIVALGWIKGATESYSPAIYLMIALCMAAFVCVYVIKRTTYRSESVAAST
ncbi:MAG: MFS transporter [Rhodospirillaceae bacterium]|nr:MFS transporter [Rhodospirillaceae bacterium]